MTKLLFTLNVHKTGFTMIELLVVIALISFLLFTSLPLTQAWVYEAKMKEAKNLMAQAFAIAKSEAIKDGSAMPNRQLASTTICHFDQTLEVRSAGTAQKTGAHCKPNLDKNIRIWQAELPSAITLTTHNKNSATPNTFSCLCLSNRGAFSNTGWCTTAAHCVNAQAAPAITVTAPGSSNEPLTFSVF